VALRWLCGFALALWLCAVNRAVKAFRGKWETSYLESASSNQDASSDEAARSAEADET